MYSVASKNGRQLERKGQYRGKETNILSRQTTAQEKYLHQCRQSRLPQQPIILSKGQWLMLYTAYGREGGEAAV